MKPVPEREAAKAAGERFYHTGKPCRNGHIGKRYTRDGICSACAVAKQLKYQATASEDPARAAARTAGETHYAQGKPCKHGHPDKRFVSNGLCVTCSNDRTKRWHKARPGYEAGKARERRAADPTGHREASKKWARANRVRANETCARWKERHPDLARERGRMYVAMRRTRQLENGGSFTAEDIVVIHERQGGACAACTILTTDMEIDHIVAVVNGGTSDPSNLQLLCLSCNRSKGKKDMNVWMQEKGFDL